MGKLTRGYVSITSLVLALTAFGPRQSFAQSQEKDLAGFAKKGRSFSAGIVYQPGKGFDAVIEGAQVKDAIRGSQKVLADGIFSSLAKPIQAAATPEQMQILNTLRFNSREDRARYEAEIATLAERLDSLSPLRSQKQLLARIQKALDASKAKANVDRRGSPITSIETLKLQFASFRPNKSNGPAQPVSFMPAASVNASSKNSSDNQNSSSLVENSESEDSHQVYSERPH